MERTLDGSEDRGRGWALVLLAALRLTTVLVVGLLWRHCCGVVEVAVVVEIGIVEIETGVVRTGVVEPACCCRDIVW
jgi:hypothetical protein